MTVFRAGLLNGRTVALAGEVPDGVRDALSELGATVHRVQPATVDDEGAASWARVNAPLDGLVIDMASAFGAGGAEGLRLALDSAWTPIRAIAAEVLIPGGEGGKIVLVAPRMGAGAYAPALRAATENLARTLSVEWARHLITVTAIAPGQTTPERDLAGLVAYLLSAAGDYFSGCVFELGAGARAAPRP